MDITAIKYFLCLAECLNFSEAAERNYISQSSFSKTIIKLEKEIGVKLVDRKHHPIALTKGGECFYRHFKAMEPVYRGAMDEDVYKRQVYDQVKEDARACFTSKKPVREMQESVS